MSHHAATAQKSSSLNELLAHAADNRIQDLPYSGEITPQECFEYLSDNAAALVDVRTLPEWQFVGLPNLHGTASKLITICWKQYPDFSQNTRFAEQLTDTDSITKDTPLFFICRSGGRSLDAAIAMQAQGYKYCFNVSDGFEGEPNASGIRGIQSGWKAQKLPWKQG